MATKAEKKQMRTRIMEINTRIGEMATSLETEKRAINQEETIERDALVQERELLKLKLAVEDNPQTQQPEKTNARAFAEVASAIRAGREVSEEYRSFVKGNDVIIPETRDIQDTASVTPLVPLTIGEIIQPLEKGLILSKVGCKMQYGMSGDWQFPVVAGVEASITGENTEINDTKIDITKIAPSPKRVSICVPVSYRAINQSNNSLLSIVQTQISMSLTRLLNKWMFSPTAIAGASNGAFVKTTPTLTYATSITWKDAIKLKGAVMKTGVVFDGTAAYVCSATTYADLESTPRDAGSGRMIIEDGKINGFPVFMTEYIGDNILGFGLFAYQMVGQFGEVRLTIDPYTGAKSNIVKFILNADFDMLTLRTEAFGTLAKA